MTEFAMRLCLLEISEATAIKSHQHDCPNLSSTGMTPGNMPRWMEKSPQGLNSIEKISGNLRKLRREREPVSGKSISSGCSVLN